MGATTKIEWTDRSWSPWWGCASVSPECANCNAKSIDRRTGGDHYGAGKPRKAMSEAHWHKPIVWDRQAARMGTRFKVFPSMCDPFDSECPTTAFDRFMDLIAATPHLDWLLLTKRPRNAAGIVTARPLPGNVWLGVTAGDQARADERIPILLSILAAVRFVSVEPMLGPVDLWRSLPRAACREDEYRRSDPKWEACGWRGGLHELNRTPDGIASCPICGSAAIDERPGLDWVICGCESGPRRRPMDVQWARDLRDQCEAAGVPFFLKQLEVAGRLVKMPFLDNIQHAATPTPASAGGER
jgi:protein gp37